MNTFTRGSQFRVGPYCQVNDVTFEDHAGNVIAGVQSPVVSAFGHPFPFLVGSTRTVTAAGGDEGMYVSQLLIGDIIPSGTVEGPRILFQPGPSQTSPATGPAFLGIGPESPTNNNFRFGHSGNEVSAWDDDGTYPTDVDVTGCWGAGIGTGSAFEGGVGVTWAAKLCPLSGGGFEIMNAAKSGDAPLKASIYRTVPTTVAGLAATDASPSVGDRAVVTDAASCAFNSAVAGGGSIKWFLGGGLRSLDYASMPDRSQRATQYVLNGRLYKTGYSRCSQQSHARGKQGAALERHPKSHKAVSDFHPGVVVNQV
jgi:hypothetical protein